MLASSCALGESRVVKILGRSFLHSSTMVYSENDQETEKRISKMAMTLQPPSKHDGWRPRFSMKPRSAVIFAIVAFVTCGDSSPAQFTDCAYITVFYPCPVSSETR